jgi:hypothetical protein
MNSKAKKLTFDGKEYFAIPEQEYKDYLKLHQYIRGGGLDGRVLMIMGPHQCDNRWIYTLERDAALEELALINKAQQEELDKLSGKTNSILNDYYRLVDAYNEKRSILAKLLNR